MKKALIATAIAAAVAAPAANAEVIIYGKVHASIDYVDFNDAYMGDYDGTLTAKAWAVSSRASRLGFKGTEDLGNGLSLIWKYETGVNVSDSPSSGGIFQGARNSYIGLSGDWGTFLYGRHDTPMKISTGRLDLFSDQIGDYNWNGSINGAQLGPGFQDLRADNAIAYISPNWNGFTAAAAIIPGENGADGANGLADGYSVAAMYSNNGLYLSAAIENVDTLTDSYGIDDKGAIGCCVTKKWRVGAGYTMNAFTINGVYEDQYDDYSHNKVWQLSGAYDFGNNRVKGAYGQASGWEGYDKSTHWAIGIDHSLSKRTQAYAAYADAKNMYDYEDGKARGFSMGMMHTF